MPEKSELLKQHSYTYIQQAEDHLNFCRENSWGSFIVFWRTLHAPCLRTRCSFTYYRLLTISVVLKRFLFLNLFVNFLLLFYSLACQILCLDFKLLRFVGNSINVSIFMQQYPHIHAYCFCTKANGVRLRHFQGLNIEFGTGKLLSAEIPQVWAWARVCVRVYVYLYVWKEYCFPHWVA